MEKLLESQIIPDVFNAASGIKVLGISYKGSTVNLGNQLPIQTVLTKPTTITCDLDKTVGSFYTLCLTDPDAPTRSAPVMRERVHWLVANIPAQEANLATVGDELIAYFPSCPPKGTGLHRYTFLLLEQPGKLDFSTEPKVDDSKEMWDMRKCFSIQGWAKKWGCTPHAANFYVAEWDNDAQVLRNKLGL